MKKMIVLFVLLASVAMAQQSVVVFSDTISNSKTKTVYIPIDRDENYKTDSISISALYTGEIDIDKLIVTLGEKTSAGTFVAISTPDTTTLSIDNAAATTTGGYYSATSTGLRLAAKGYGWARIVFISGAAGNDATDPNALRVYVKYHTSASR